MPSREEKRRRERLATRERDRRRLGYAPPSGSDNDWCWGKQMLACFDDLRAEFAEHQPPIVDRQVIPDFSGTPDGMVIWLICDRSADVAVLKAAEASLKERLQDRMRAREFPTSAVSSLWVSSTSHEEIEDGGGRFLYFR